MVPYLFYVTLAYWFGSAPNIHGYHEEVIPHMFKASTYDEAYDNCTHFGSIETQNRTKYVPGAHGNSWCVDVTADNN